MHSEAQHHFQQWVAHSLQLAKCQKSPTTDQLSQNLTTAKETLQICHIVFTNYLPYHILDVLLQFCMVFHQVSPPLHVSTIFLENVMYIHIDESKQVRYEQIPGLQHQVDKWLQTSVSASSGRREDDFCIYNKKTQKYRYKM